MLALPHTNSWGFIYRNPTPFVDAVPGVTVTPGASDVEGSVWGEIGPDASITTDIFYCKLHVHSGATSGQIKSHLLDFGWDPAGGTAYVPWFSDLACGGSAAAALAGVVSGQEYHFPCKIPAGSAIAVRAQGSNGTAGTVRVVGTFYGKPSRPELWQPAAYTETLGYTSGTLGTTFTPGTDAFGTWASLGTTTKKHFWAQIGAQLNNAATAQHSVQVQLGIGGGAADDTHVVTETTIHSDGSERISSTLQQPCTWEIPAGATVYVRGSCESAPDTGWNATAVLFGG